VFENYFSLGFHNDYLLPNIRMGCKLLKILSLEFQISLILSIVCLSSHPSCRHSCHCPLSAETEVCDNILSVPSFFHRMDSEAAPFHPVLLQSEPSLMSEPKMQTFSLQSRQDREKVHCQTSTSTPGSTDVSTTSTLMISAKNSNRMLGRLDSPLMCAESVNSLWGAR